MGLKIVQNSSFRGLIKKAHRLNYVVTKSRFVATEFVANSIVTKPGFVATEFCC